MLKVTLEIIPFGDKKHPSCREIGSLTIGCQRVKEDDIGEYSSVMSTDGQCLVPRPVVFIDHPRKEGAFELVKHALTEHLNLDVPKISDAIAKAFLAEIEDYAPFVREVAEIFTPELKLDWEPEEPDTCAACGSTDLMGCEYTFDHPNYYDGVSEYHCMDCPARTGRWSGKILKEDESERPFGR